MRKATRSLGLAAALRVLMATGACEPASVRNQTKRDTKPHTITLPVYDYVRVDGPTLIAVEGEAAAIVAQVGGGAVLPRAIIV